MFRPSAAVGKFIEAAGFFRRPAVAQACYIRLHVSGNHHIYTEINPQTKCDYIHQASYHPNVGMWVFRPQGKEPASRHDSSGGPTAGA